MLSGYTKNVHIWGAAILGMSLLAASVNATPLNPGDTQWKTNGSVSTTPKFATNLPSYFAAANMVEAPLIAPMVGTISGSVVSTVYRNPDTNTLSFDYRFIRDSSTTVAIIAATLDGGWSGISILNAGANASGTSGTGDNNPEWTDGDPLYLLRDPDLEAPALYWRQSALGTIIGKSNTSSHIFFETDATVYQLSVSSMLAASNNSSLANIFSPQYVVPEPASLVLLSAVAMMLRRRRFA